MKSIPPELITTVRQLAAKEMPVEQIAFMTRLDDTVVHKILAIASDPIPRTDAAKPKKR